MRLTATSRSITASSAKPMPGSHGAHRSRIPTGRARIVITRHHATGIATRSMKTSFIRVFER